MTRVVLHIDRVRLRGFPREQRHAIIAGLRDELARVFADSRFTRDGAIPRLLLEQVRLAPGASPRTAGTLVARAFGRKARS